MWSWDWVSFDFIKGIQTSGIVPIEGMEIIGPNAAHGVFYEPTPVRYFDTALRALPIDFSRFDFVDLGSGMGRTLIQATKFPFRQIIGVEFSRELHGKAESNIAKFLNTKRVAVRPQSIYCDAVDYQFQMRDCVIFMFNPFNAYVMSQLLVKLQDIGEQRRILVVYCEAKQHKLIVESGFLRWAFDVPLPLSFTRWKGWISNIKIYSNFM